MLQVANWTLSLEARLLTICDHKWQTILWHIATSSSSKSGLAMDGLRMIKASSNNFCLENLNGFLLAAEIDGCLGPVLTKTQPGKLGTCCEKVTECPHCISLCV